MFITLQYDAAEDRVIKINVHPNINIMIKPNNIAYSSPDTCTINWQGKDYTIYESIESVEAKINKAIIVEQAAINQQLRRHLQDLLVD
jgi:hypothetical protein